MKTALVEIGVLVLQLFLRFILKCSGFVCIFVFEEVLVNIDLSVYLQ